MSDLNITPENISTTSKSVCVEWLMQHGLSTSGSLKELQERISKCLKYPVLSQKLYLKAQQNFQFVASLHANEIPPLAAEWVCGEEQYPRVAAEHVENYVSTKREGLSGQQQKGYMMLTSRKIVTVKTISLEKNIFVRALIKKSYGHEARPAVILFLGGVPTKAYCECPVGLCCHVIALLLYLKHYTETKEKILELTCTQVLQKWHKRSKQGSIPMVTLSDIKVKSSKKSNSDITKTRAVPADSDLTFLKRNVAEINAKVIDRLRGEEKEIEKHVYEVLSSTNLGYESSLMGHLNYNYNPETITSDNIEFEILPISRTFMERKENLVAVEKDVTDDQELQNIIVEQGTLGIEIKTNSDESIINNVQRQISQNTETVIINISNLSPTQTLFSNYVEIDQNTQEWLQLRKSKITGSRLPALLGLYGKNKFEIYLKIVKKERSENEFFNFQFKNFERGHEFEPIALKQFNKISNAAAMACGFFHHPNHSNYGASPDALVSEHIILEIKTRAQKSEGPLTNIEKQTQYYVQCQLQMQCTKAKLCMLQSYHPESNKSNFFLMQTNYLFLDVIKNVKDSILKEQQITEWHHRENHYLSMLGKNITNKIPDFDSLKPLRTYIKDTVKKNVYVTNLLS